MIGGKLRRIDPIAELGGDLLGVEKPSRYLGGEALSSRKTEDCLFTIALCFPDLYEIGMSNNAIRILYSGINARSGLRAERVFSPAPDFEALLERKGLPLYTLETGIALPDVDLLGISIGYELAATSIVTILKAGRLPIRTSERGECDPLVIGGGPASTNPHPYALFFDAVYIGEAEAGFYELCESLSALKRSGAKRNDLLDRIVQESAMWMPALNGRPAKRATRAIYSGFSESPTFTGVPLPTVKTVQDHGTVEIMRGCPNGCRFCHAGFYYRPQRVKSYEVITSEVEALVRGGGYREITLSSLSSGDYPGIGELLDALNAEWGGRRVSFQLPSLKISSFTLPIVRKLAEVRKSGLTFAVETPVDEWQRMINKDVSFEKTVAILEEAKAAGFKQAKFYFMIGLPVPGRGLGEARAIVDFFERLGKRVQLQINVNVGTFVPKPHTPFQWAAQLTEEEALEAVNYLRSELKRFKNIKLSYHSPFISLLEGIIARGDERVGELILAAQEKGARLDAWEEHFDRELWRSVIDGAQWPVIAECCGERDPESALAWDDISLRVSKATYKRELQRCIDQSTTSACTEKCTDLCGACGSDAKVVQNSRQAETIAAATPTRISGSPKEPEVPLVSKPSRRAIGRIVFRYSKSGPAAYLQHLSIVDAFDRAFLMADFDIAYSEGFNPMPRLETAQPLPIAIESRCEIASLLVCSELNPEAFISGTKDRLPKGLVVEEAAYFPLHEGKKQRTIGSLEWGSVYSICTLEGESTSFLEDSLRAILEERAVSGYRLEKATDGASLLLRLKLPDNKEQGLMRILETASDKRPVQTVFHPRREKLLALIRGGSDVVSFFEAYALLDKE
jgi:radical SAM family uncharacterized protein/radical SAM-linked protein